jgi:hypothetical protein
MAGSAVARSGYEIGALPGAGVRARVALAAGMLTAGILIVAFDPAATWWFPSCPLHALTGWLCPLCGSLRALHALLLGAPAAAFSLNPLTTTGAVAGLVAWVLRNLSAPFGWIGR